MPKSSAKKKAKAAETQQQEQDGPPENTPAQADAAAIAYQEKLLFDMIDYELEYVLVDREGREKHWKYLLVRMFYFTLLCCFCFVIIYCILCIVNYPPRYVYLSFFLNHVHSPIDFFVIFETQTLWEMYPEEKKDDRLHIRFQMCQILMDACGKPAYNVGSLVHWDAASWAELHQDVVELHTMCTSYMHEANAFSRTGRTCERVLTSIEVSRVTAPIRKKLEDQIRDNTKAAGIRKSAIDKVYADLINYNNNKYPLVKVYLSELFQKDEENGPEATLNRLDVLTKVLGGKPFDLKWVQSKIETLIHAYNEICFHNQAPTLWKLGYNVPKVAKLTPARKSSSKKEKATPVAAAAAKSPAGLSAEAGTPQKQSTSAMRLSFEDSGDEFETQRLGSIKRKRRRMSAPGVNPGNKSRYKGVAPDEGIFGEFGLVKERRPYSDEEVNAIIAGVLKHGVGKWVEIKNDYPQILRNRSSVQVKDKYRTLKRKRQLPEELLAAEEEKEAAKGKSATEQDAEEPTDHDGMVAEL